MMPSHRQPDDSSIDAPAASEGRAAVPAGPERPVAGRGYWEPMPSGNAAASGWQAPQFPEEEQETDIGRTTDFGEPPPMPVVADRAVLLRLEGVEAGRVYSVGAQPASLGRHPDNELVIDDSGISRHHATVTWESGRHVVEDRGSRNGTFVQGRPVTRTVLEDGDLIQLGPSVGLRYSLVDERQEDLLRRLYDSSNRDALTGSYNRKHYNDRLASEVAYAIRHRTELSLIMFDIDHFKNVNDTHGHAAGDAVLKQLAVTIQRQLRTEDIFARIGGEEFAVVLRGIPLNGAARLAERLRATVAALPVVHSGRAIPVTISLGCAGQAEPECIDDTALMRVADERLYAAKHAGRNRVVGR